MQNISKVRNIVTTILLLSIIFSIVLFSYLYNNLLSYNIENANNNLQLIFFVFFIGNFIFSGILMIYLYNSMTKWSIEEKVLQRSYSEANAQISRMEAEKKENSISENTFKVSFEEFIKNFDECKDLNDISKKIFLEISKIIELTSAVFYIYDKISETYVPNSYYAILLEEISSFKVGEGLNGQVAKNKKEIVLFSLEEKYFNIVSGLGTAQPSCLAIFPILIDKNIEGVVEMSSFVAFTDEEIEFFKVLFSRLSKFKNIEVV
ncbi:MAG: hypothetical protein A2033_07000 [Bacteroidetes bacterium GWA2_31_9]|nr:MAG: hypothetical protein A2033_07000 [Bacteroidetes bacterium GWA2_31_9]